MPEPNIVIQKQAGVSEDTVNLKALTYKEIALLCQNDRTKIQAYLKDFSEEDRYQIAKISATEDSRNISFNISKYGITNQDYLTDIALAAAQKDGWSTSYFIQNYGIASKESLVKIGEISAAQNGGMSAHIQNYGIEDPKILIKIAKIAAAQNGEETSRYIENYGITDPKELTVIARIAATNSSGTSKYIKNYYITSQEDLAEIAKLSASQNGVETSAHIGNYGIINQKELVKIAIIAIQQSQASASIEIKKYGIISEDDLYTVAKVAAKEKGTGFADSITSYDGIKNESLRIELAKITASRIGSGIGRNIKDFGIKNKKALVAIARMAAAVECDGYGGVSAEIENFGIKNYKTLVEIAKTAAKQSGYAVSYSIDQYGIKNRDDSFAWIIKKIPIIKNYYLKKEQNLIEIAKIAAANDGKYTLHYIANYGIQDKKELFEILKIGMKQSPESIISFHKHSGLFPVREEVVERIQDIIAWIREIDPRYSDRLSECLDEVSGIETLPSALSLVIKQWDNLDHNSNINLSRQALIKTAEIDLPVHELSADSRRKLYEVILTAKLPLNEQIEVSKDAWEKRFNDVLDSVSYLSALNSLSGSYPKVNLNLDNIITTKELIEKSLSETFAKVMGFESGNLKVGQLIKNWGDLTPITVLAGRYQAGNHIWQSELPVLKEICLRVLDGSFHDWKYNQDQLSMLNDQQIIKWRENPSSLQLHTATVEKQDNPVEYAKQIFTRNLLVHLPQKTVIAFRQIKEISDSLIDISENEFAKVHNLASSIATINYLLNEGDSIRLGKFISKFNSNTLKVLAGIPDNEAKQIKEDIKSIQDAVRTKKVDEGKQYLVFSTITDDPKLLLTIGDLVNTASCQNYKTGNYIQTLPGYVMDANIKAALSFPIAWGRIQSIFGADVKPEDLKYEFNAARLQLTLKVNDKEEVIELGKAIRRSIIRLGATDQDEPALFVEQAYLQTHAVMSAIQEQETGLVAVVRQSIGAKQNVKIFFPESKNPGGVYTDAGGGVMTDNYVIDIKKRV